MEVNEAPEKIWLGKYTQSLMLSNPNSNTYVEYVHKDAFIEKAWDWIEDNMLSSNQQDKSRFYYEQFINYMKGE
jgi:hypothetical protein